MTGETNKQNNKNEGEREKERERKRQSQKVFNEIKFAKTNFEKFSFLGPVSLLLLLLPLFLTKEITITWKNKG